MSLTNRAVSDAIPTSVCVGRFRDLLRDDGDEPKRLLKRDGLLGHYSRVRRPGRRLSWPSL